MPGVPPPSPSDLEALAQEVAALSDSDPARCLAQARTALATAERLGDHRRLALILCDRGYAANRISQAPAARLDYRRALELARELNDAEIESLAHNGLGNAASALGEHARALAHFEAALAIRRQRGNQEGVIGCLNNIALCNTVMLQFDMAEALYREGLALARELGTKSNETILLSNIALLHLTHAQVLEDTAQGPHADLISAAVEAASAACALAEEVGHPAWIIATRATLALALASAGDAAPAEVLANEVLAEAPAMQLVEAQVEASQARALVLLGRQAPAAAIELLQSSCRLAEMHGHRELVRTGMHLLAQAYELADDASAALACFRRYHQITLSQRDRAAEQRAEVLAASLELERSRHEAEQARLRTRELESANRTLFVQAMEDSLTGLPNRRQLEGELAERLARGERLAFVMADVDHFKAINDSYSHGVGDAVLREIGELLREHCRDEDLAARVGGEEFALVLDNVEQLTAEAVCERVRHAISRHTWGGLHETLRVTMSFGLAWSRPEGDSPASLIARADAALYRAKAAGRNRIATEAL